MTCGVYLITNIINGHKYVGQSKNIEQRFKGHCRDGKFGKNSAIDVAIQKYGENNFQLEILEELPHNPKLLSEKEIFWIDYYNTYDNPSDYNLTRGGEFPFGNPMNYPELRKKVSDAKKGVPLSEEAKAKLSKAHKGRKHTPEAIEKIRQTSTGRKWSEHQKERYSNERMGEGNPMYNKHHSLKHNLELSKKRNNTGFFRVKKAKNSSKMGFGFTWQYHYYKNGKKVRISNINLSLLEEKIRNMGLEWIIIDENKAKQSYTENIIKNTDKNKRIMCLGLI